MTQLLVALAVTGASAALMYVVCLRPMRRGHCAAVHRATASHELAQLRREITQLRHRTGAR